MASKRHVRKKQCGDKLKHATKEHAYAHLKHLQKEKQANGMSVYHCRFCNAYHIGHHTAKRG